MPISNLSRKSNANSYLKPEIAFNRLLFPAPEGPKIVERCPASNLPLTPCKIVFGSERKLKVLPFIESESKVNVRSAKVTVSDKLTFLGDHALADVVTICS